MEWCSWLDVNLNGNNKYGVWISLTPLSSYSANPSLSYSIPKTFSLQKNVQIPHWGFKALVYLSGPVYHYKTIPQLHWWILGSGRSTAASTLLTPTLCCSPAAPGLSFLSLLYSHDSYPSWWTWSYIPLPRWKTLSPQTSPFPTIV